EATLVLICSIQDPLTRQDYSRDPRFIARKAINYMKQSGIADTAFLGPELEFFVFDSARFDQNQYSGYYFLDSAEGAWNSGRDERCSVTGHSNNLAYKIRQKEGYFPVPPADTLQDLRTEMMLNLIEAGIDVEAQH